MTTPALKLAAREIPDTATCLIYARVSTTEQAASDRASLADQETRCRALAAKLGFPQQFLWSDPGRSGTDPRRLDDLVSWCESHPRHKHRGLITVYSPDRFARLGTALVGFYTVRLDRAGWDLRYVDLDRTGNALVDGVSGSLRAELAAEESRIKSVRALQGMPARAKLGRWQGGKLPPGWALKDGRPVPGTAAEQQRVLRWFERCDAGEQLAAIADPIGMHRTSLRRVLVNPIYGGRFTWGRRAGSQVEPVTAEVDSWIPAGLYRRVQQRLSGGRYAPRARHGIVKYMLSGAVTCTACDATLVGAGGASLHVKHPENQRAYRHSPKARASGCSLRVNQAWLEGTVLALVSDAVARLFDSGEVEKGIDALLKDEANTAGDRLGLERDKRNLDAQRSRIVDAIAEGVLGKDDARAKLDSLKTEAARIDAALNVETSRPSRSKLAADRAELLIMAKHLPARLRAADASTARLLLKPWVESITVTPHDKLTVRVRALPSHTSERSARRAPHIMTLTAALPQGRCTR